MASGRSLRSFVDNANSSVNFGQIRKIFLKYLVGSPGFRIARSLIVLCFVNPDEFYSESRGSRHLEN